MVKEKAEKAKAEMGVDIDSLAVFCKRKGFVYPSGEIYGGLAGFWDYGAQLKEAQVSGFTPNGKPIIYVVGYHTAVGLLQSTRKMSIAAEVFFYFCLSRFF